MKENYCILLLEDDPNLGSILEEHLQMNGFDVVRCNDGELGLSTWKKHRFDLCLVDIMMPKVDGFTFVQTVRKENSEIPIIFLTAKSLKEDKIKGFKVGCDDYITKPFSIEELLLRIEAVLKRAYRQHTNDIQTLFSVGQFTFDYNRQMLNKGKSKKKLTPRESELLFLLCKQMNKTVSREQALREIWEDDSFFAGRSMDVYISKLRKYLRDDPTIEIVSLHGKGFRLVTETKK